MGSNAELLSNIKDLELKHYFGVMWLSFTGGIFILMGHSLSFLDLWWMSFISFG